MCFVIPVFPQNNETMTIVTYYPSPYGVYKNLRLFPSPAPACNSDSEGTLYYDSTVNELKLCREATTFPFNFYWQTLGQGNLWKLEGNNLLHPAQDAYNVGIGLNNPVNKLDVAGPVAVGQSSSGLMSLLVKGQVGIGTTPTPAAEMLAVAGPVKIGSYTLPSADGTNGQALVTDGNGNVTWQSLNNITVPGAYSAMAYRPSTTSCSGFILYFGQMTCNIDNTVTCPCSPSCGTYASGSGCVGISGAELCTCYCYCL